MSQRFAVRAFGARQKMKSPGKWEQSFYVQVARPDDPEFRQVAELPISRLTFDRIQQAVREADGPSPVVLLDLDPKVSQAACLTINVE